VKHWRTGTSSKNSINACSHVTSRDARVSLSRSFSPDSTYYPSYCFTGLLQQIILISVVWGERTLYNSFPPPFFYKGTPVRVASEGGYPVPNLFSVSSISRSRTCHIIEWRRRVRKVPEVRLKFSRYFA
jgi:hypothetical protein